MDGGVNSLDTYYSEKLYEVAPYVTVAGSKTGSSLLIGPAQVAMNLDVWKSLPADLQKIVGDAFDEAGQKLASDTLKKRVEILSALEAMPKVNVYYLPDEERARWKAILTPIFQEYSKKHGEDFSRWMALTEKYSQ